MSAPMKSYPLLDESCIERTGGRFTFRIVRPEPESANPLIVPDPAIETDHIFHGSVHRDDETGRYRMWYENILRLPREKVEPGTWGVHADLCVAESADGLNWTRPGLGRVERNGSTENNIMMAYDTYVDYPAILHDPADPDPQKRFKMVLYVGRHQVTDRCNMLFCSPDGLNWDEGREAGTWPTNDTSVLWRHPESGMYHLYSKRHTPRRVRNVSKSSDLYLWPKAEVFLAPDGEDLWDSHLYFFIPQKIRDYYVAYLGIYQTRPRSDQVNFQLAFSRDGETWQRAADREVFLPNDPDPEHFTHGFLSILTFPVIRDDLIEIYYTGRNTQHNDHTVPCVSGIGRSVLPMDRFFACTTWHEAELVSAVLDLPQPARVLVNGRTFDSGEIRIEAFSDDGINAPGAIFGVIHGDHLQADTGVTLPAGRHRLRFRLRRAELYAFYLDPLRDTDMAAE